MAIAWTLRLPVVSCTLVGAKNPQQLSEHRGAVGINFSTSELDRIDSILAQS
jgi:aryl-alcohol dehydrogenase-like predicted oxidoreductase